jgi:tRNA A-37 threonylcarbamoyl transferase component Bud32
MESFYAYRDRVAYALFLQKDFARKILFSLSLGVALSLSGSGLWLNRDPGPNPAWRIYLPPAPVSGVCAGLACMALCVAAPFWGGVAYFFFFLGLVAVYIPEILGPAAIVVGLTVFTWFMVRPQRGAMSALVLIPFLEVFFGWGALAPLGFACFYPPARAILLSATAFGWIEAVGLMHGGIPRFGFDDSGLASRFHWLASTQLTGLPWSQEILNASHAMLGMIREDLVGKGDLLWPLLIQTALAAAVVGVVRSLYHPVKFHDRLAIEYISTEGEKRFGASIRFLQAPLAVFVGLVVWISCQLFLSFFFPGIYSSWLFGMDILAGFLLMPIVLLHYLGDPIMPHEFSHPASEGSAHHGPSGSSFRVPTPSEMRLHAPSLPPIRPGKKDPSQVRLKSWKDRVDLEWEGILPDGRKLRYEKEKDETPLLSKQLASGGEGFEVGKKIDGQYRIEQVLRGGMGVVFIVTDEFSEVRYAVKTLREDLRANVEAGTRFSGEAKTWIRLGHHPNIVQAMYYREIAGRPLLFLEYIDGTDLEEVFARPGPGPALPTLVDWGIQVCEGMHHASTKDIGGGVIGLVHRDIKPGNLMLTRDGQVKITDFGLAKAAEAPTSLTREKVGLGTLKYMAPEQVKDAKHVDLRADIYAVGAVLYEGLAGHPPFTDEDSVDLYMSVLSKDPQRIRKIRPDVPEDLDRIVMRCLQKDREQRYSSFEELSWALRRFQDLMKGGGGGSHLRVVN